MFKFSELRPVHLLVLLCLVAVFLWVINFVTVGSRDLNLTNVCAISGFKFSSNQCDAKTKRLLQLLESHSFDDKKIILAAANMGHLKLVLNWVENMRQKVQGGDKFLIGCMDVKLSKALERRAVPSFLIEDFVSVPNISQEQVWGTTEYNRVVNTKIKLVDYVVNTLQYTVIFSDVDTAWLSPQVVSLPIGQLNNPLEPKDITFAQDHRHICTGFYAVRPTPFIKTLFESVLKKMTKKDTNDQFIFAYLIERRLSEEERKKIGKLPVTLYMNGKTIREHNFRNPSAIKPWFVHANSAVGMREKVLLLKKAKSWLI